jgi:DNA excision repair protein ERCC-4
MSFRIVVDERERNSKVPKFLINNGVHVDFARLVVGDYIVSSEVAIERKTIRDLVNSIYDGRLFVQCSDLLQFYSKPLLIVEGNILELKTDIENDIDYHQKEKIALNKITQIYDALATVAPSAKYTSKFLISLSKKILQSNLFLNGPLIKKIKKANHVQLQQLSILSSLPGIGDKLALKLLEKFKTPLKAINASTAELAMIPGFGIARAEKIKKILDFEYEEKHLAYQKKLL